MRWASKYVYLMDVVIEIPFEIYRMLEKSALRKNKTALDIIVEKSCEDRDPNTRVYVYLKLYEKYVREAEEFYRRGAQ